MNHNKSILMLAVLACTLVLAQVGAAATADFFTVPAYSTGTGGIVIATGDFNHDGITDVATAGASSVSVMLGNRNGSFQAATSYAITAGVVSLAVGDFNNDGRQDLVVLLGTGSVALNLLLGNGDGTFQQAHSLFYQGLQRAALVVGDFNKDGNLDLATVNTLSRTVSVLLGKGNGGFQPAVNYSTGIYQPVSLTVGDINNDGKLDLIAGTGITKIFLGNGDGTFTGAADGPLATFRVFLADLNQDGKLDLVSADGFTNLYISLGNGDGTFQSPVSFTATSSKNNQCVAVLDLNGDGKPDIVTGGSNQILTVLLGNGDGTLQAGTVYAVGSYLSGIVSGKFGNGQKPGIAIVDSNLAAVELATPNLDGTLQAPRVTTVPGPQSAAIGDINGDGKTDVAIGYGGDLDILYGIGNGLFQAPIVYSLGVEIGSIAIGDLNGDGKPDVVFATAFNNTGSVDVLLNNGDGTLGTPVSYNVGTDTIGIAVGDFNGDHKLDIAVTSFKDNTLSVLLNNGDGSFQPAVPTGTAFGAQTLTLADFNGDGKLDVAVQGSVMVSVMLGQGDGTFSSVKNYPAGSHGITSIHNADFNGDGHPDLVLSDFGASSSTVNVLLNNGDGTFQAPAMLSVGYGPTNLEVGDFNGDGKQDIAVAIGSTATHQIDVLNGKGDGTFQPLSALTVCTTYYYNFLFAANFNADPRPDLLDVCNSEFVVLPNAAGPH